MAPSVYNWDEVTLKFVNNSLKNVYIYIFIFSRYLNIQRFFKLLRVEKLKNYSFVLIISENKIFIQTEI